MMRVCAAAAVFVVLCGAWAVAAPATASDLAGGEGKAIPLVPWPKSVQPGGNGMELTPASRIVCADPSLKSLAEVLGDEIHLATALRLSPAEGPPRAGDIVVALAPELTGEDRGFGLFRGALTARVSCPPIGTIRFTLDGKEPGPQSPAYAGPLTIDKSHTRAEKLFFNSRTKRYETTGDVVRLKARIFDPTGKPLGEMVTVKPYWHQEAQ